MTAPLPSSSFRVASAFQAICSSVRASRSGSAGRARLKDVRPKTVLRRAATSGDPSYFLGTDSAPHATSAKETACGCAGIYTAHAAIELYAEAFESVDALNRLEAFASFHGADFYSLPRNQRRVRLVRESWTVPGSYPFGDDVVIPLRAGEEIKWRVERVE